MGVAASPEPSYVNLARRDQLEERVWQLDALLTDCTVCPRLCRVDRRRTRGVCGTGIYPEVASHGPSLDGEPVLCGSNGAGSVVLANCNLHCVFCHNYVGTQAVSHIEGRKLSAVDLAAVFLDLQGRGCHNLTWTAPSHQVPQLVRALDLATREGLRIPVVYNSNAYDSPAVLRLLDGVVDVYVPDLKYSEPLPAEQVSGAPEYPKHAREALREMYRQVGTTWELEPHGTLQRGMLVRIQVLPYDLAGVEASLEWLARELSPRLAVSLRAAVRSCLGAGETRRASPVDRDLTLEEWRIARWALGEHNSGDHVFVEQ